MLKDNAAARYSTTTTLHAHLCMNSEPFAASATATTVVVVVIMHPRCDVVLLRVVVLWAPPSL